MLVLKNTKKISVLKHFNAKNNFSVKKYEKNCVKKYKSLIKLIYWLTYFT